MRFVLLISALFLNNLLSAVNMGLPELVWAVFHPLAAIKVKSIAKKCDRISDHKKIKNSLDSFPAGGKADAYRHVFYMAAFAQKVRPKKISKLGIAHEKTNYRQFLKNKTEDGERPDSLACEMDLLNNALGIQLGRENRKIPLETLQQVVIQKINAGEAFILKRNSKGQYIDCEGRMIYTENFRAQWHVPKCLVHSDE